MKSTFKFPLFSLIPGLALLVVASPASAIIKAIDQSIVLGPVVLHEQARFEVCANSKFIPETEEIGVQVRFVRVRDGASLEKEFLLGPGQNGCASVSFEQAGTAPIFATLDTFGTDLPEIDLVVSSAVINGIFDAPKPQVLLEDQSRRTSTLFGPLVIPEGKRVEVCAHNDNENPESEEFDLTTPVVVNFYNAAQSLEPLLSRESFLRPGRGGCTSLTAERARGRDVLIEVLTEPAQPGQSIPLPVIGTYIINGVFESPLPPDFRYLD